MSEQLAKLAVVHWGLIAGNNAYALDRMYDELHDPEIHSIVFELQEIQTHLNDLELWFRDERILRLMPTEVRDIETAIGSCTRSLGRIEGIVKGVVSSRRGQATGLLWGEIKAKFREAEGDLLTKLNVHRVFLTQLFPILKLHFKPQNRAEMERVHHQVRSVSGNTHDRTLHEHRLRQWEEYHRRVAAEQAYNNRYAQPPSPEYSPTGRPTGFVPMRPQSASFHQGYGPPTSTHPEPVVRPGGSYYHPYPSPPTSSSSVPSASASPPPRPPSRAHRPSTGIHAPPIPYGPATGANIGRPPSRPCSRGSSRPHRSQPSRPEYHDSSPASPYRPPRERPRASNFSASQEEGSKCFGLNIDQLSISPDEQRVLEAEFDNDLIVELYRNSETEAARVVCTVDYVGSWINDSRGGARYQSSMKASFLSVRRHGSTLLLTRRKNIWARLYFSDFENMVFFFHTFLALRSYGPEAPDITSHEKWLTGEVPLFDAMISDNGQYNRLFVLRDSETETVRLVCVRDSDPQQDLVLWTAYIIDEPAPIRRSSVIVFDNLRVYYFGSLEYTFKGHEDFCLRFLNSQDAIAFEDTIAEL